MQSEDNSASLSNFTKLSQFAELFLATFAAVRNGWGLKIIKDRSASRSLWELLTYELKVLCSVNIAKDIANRAVVVHRRVNRLRLKINVSLSWTDV